MPSTPTTRLRLEKQALGENTDIWGDTKLNDALSRIDEAVAGVVTIAIAGPSTTLTSANYTADQARYAAIKLTGTLSANSTVTVPSAEKLYLIDNQTTQGAYSLTVKTAAGTGYALRSGPQRVYCNGTDVYRGTPRLDQVPAPGAAVDMAGQKLTGLGAPTTATDAVTKGYCDALSLGGGGGAVDPNTLAVTASGATASRALNARFADGVNVADFGAIGNGVTVNDTAFLAAEAVADLIYVPAGTYQLSTPLALGESAFYYGPGVLRFTLADYPRRGGSSGGISVPEKYTLFYEYSVSGDVSVLFNGVAQVITWIDLNTVQAPGSLITDAVTVRIANGTLRLGMAPQSIRSFNSLGGGGSLLNATKPNAITTEKGYNNASYGSRALNLIRDGVNNTAFGSRACMDSLDNDNQTGVGFQALYRSRGDGNTAVGSIAGEWLVGGTYNTLIGGAAGGKLTEGDYNVALGYQALVDHEECDYTVAVGHRAMGNPSQTGASNNVAVGTFAGDFLSGTSCTFVGYRAGCGPNTTSTPGSGNVGIENSYFGFFAGRNNSTGSKNVGVGVSALLALTTGDNSVAVGHNAGQALTTGGNLTAVGFEALKVATVSSPVAVGYRALTALTTGAGCTAVGNQALAANVTAADCTAVGEAALLLSTGANNTAIGARALGAQVGAANSTGVGYEAGRFATGGNHAFFGYRAGRGTTSGTDNTALGADALQNETTGTTNTAVGRRALRLKQDGTNQTCFDNCSGLGFDAACSASNQVQLGNSSTTTYAYGAVQNRSDARDKADVRDTVLGLKFVQALRPVDFRWDYREDYEDRQPDGSRKRKRYHHGLIAQEVRDVLEAQRIDFGGLQDHAINGGCDVLSLGYEELVGPLIKSIQELAARVAELEQR